MSEVNVSNPSTKAQDSTLSEAEGSNHGVKTVYAICTGRMARGHQGWDMLANLAG